MTANQIRVNDINIRYRWEGNPDGPVLMMAHAMGTNLHLWDWQMPALCDRYRILRYDWRGHGQTDAPPGAYSLSQFESDAVGLMDALALSKVNWVGISTGGMIGQGLGINYPDRIASLALCNTTSAATTWYRDWVKERQRVVREEGMNAVWEMTKNLWFTDAFVSSENADFCAVRDEFVKTTVTGYIGGTSAVANLAYQPHLHKVSVPTLVIAAGDDPVTPLDHAHAIHDRIDGAELAVLDGQRHFSNVEVPAAFNAALRSFLDRVTAQTTAG
ncbi:MAG: alpha/beta fold hydrolase [Gammaproteobacteria bacterium]|nr:alpha/beta fold hydrolase [Gammaproteobacteria bacterium]